MKVDGTTYYCSDCSLTFSVHRRNYGSGRRAVYCPSCADSVNVKLKGRNEKRWTAEEEKKLIKLTQLGLTKMQIAAKLGRSYKSVSSKRVRMNHEKRGRTN